MHTETNRLSYSVPDAARLLGISPRAVYTRIGTGEIQSFKVGPRRLISHEALRNFISVSEAAAA